MIDPITVIFLKLALFYGLGQVALWVATFVLMRRVEKLEEHRRQERSGRGQSGTPPIRFGR